VSSCAPRTKSAIRPTCTRKCAPCSATCLSNGALAHPDASRLASFFPPFFCFFLQSMLCTPAFDQWKSICTHAQHAHKKTNHSDRTKSATETCPTCSDSAPVFCPLLGICVSSIYVCTAPPDTSGKTLAPSSSSGTSVFGTVVIVLVATTLMGGVFFVMWRRQRARYVVSLFTKKEKPKKTYARLFFKDCTTTSEPSCPAICLWRNSTLAEAFLLKFPCEGRAVARFLRAGATRSRLSYSSQRQEQ